MNAFAHSRNVDNGIKIEIDKSNVYCPNHEGSVCFTRINGRNCCLLFSSAACQLVNLYKSNLARQDASAFCEMAKKSCLRMILATCQPKNFIGRFSATCQLITLQNFNLLRIYASAFCEMAKMIFQDDFSYLSTKSFKMFLSYLSTRHVVQLQLAQNRYKCFL